MDSLFKAHLETSILELKHHIEVWTEIAEAIRSEGKEDLVPGVVSMIHVVTRDIQSLADKLAYTRRPSLCQATTY